METVRDLEPDQVGTLRDYLQLISEEINSSSSCVGHLPSDLATVNPFAADFTTVLSKEALYTSGGIWKTETLGCIMYLNSKVCGVSAAHVHKVYDSEFNDLRLSDGECFSLKLPEMDCSIFEMKLPRDGLSGRHHTTGDLSAKMQAVSIDDSSSAVPAVAASASSGTEVGVSSVNTVPGHKLYNLVPLKLVSHDEIKLTRGELVYKIGKETGMSIGKFEGTNVFFKDPHTGEQYHEAVEVKWEEDTDVRFASHGDCGALYCVRRSGMFASTAIHRGSGEKTSYGSDFLVSIGSSSRRGQGSVFLNPPVFALLAES